ncbi:hypothetical protein [Paenibacillus jiagnxiensis]|uniref:hypothetical protein n=1 Tax=Paenibacillus jiagnxiensis TaxID=3228926 RepID=UPI0033A3BD91
MNYRQHAYKEEIKRLEMVTVPDRKGTWSAGHLSRYIYTLQGRVQFSLTVYFKVNLERFPKANPHNDMATVYLFIGDTTTQLKRRIKVTLGYTPETSTVSELWEHFNRLRRAYEEEDAYYASQDKEQAKAVLDELYETAKQRIERGEAVAVASDYKRDRRLPYERYLTPKEIWRAAEAQCVLNGCSFQEPMTIIARTGHLAEFNRRIDEALESWKARNTSEEQRKQTQDFLHLLEVDVQFRKLAANLLDASREIRTADYRVELAHRYFGFTDSLDDYRIKALKPLDELLLPYGLESFTLYKLFPVIEQYLEGGGVLPPPSALQERHPDRFYYDDRVHNGASTFRVLGVGHVYVYLDRGEREKKKRLSHYAKAPYVQDPASVEDFVSNELARLNNQLKVPNAHLKEFEYVIRQLGKGRHTATKLRMLYKMRMMRATVPEERRAMELFRDGFRCLELGQQVENLRQLTGIGHQPALVPAEEELESLMEKHGFRFLGRAEPITC